MSRLHFRDIQDWTPASVSIVDKPYHPLAVFEVYEDDDEFIKKFSNPQEVNVMTQNNPTPGNAGDNVTVSGGFLERLLDRVVAKNEPTPDEDPTTKKILEKLNTIEENQAKANERLDALENPEGDPAEPPAESNNAEGDTEGDPAEPPAEPEMKTVELPLNSDGTLDMENEVVAKYLPSGNGNSQSVDPDLTITPRTDKSFNERSGRNSNGMSW